ELGTAQSVRDVVVIPSGVDPNTDVVLVATDVGLFRSTDGGASYTQIQGGPGEVFENQKSALWNIVQTSAGFLVEAQPCTTQPADLCGSAGTIYVSTDQGASWAALLNTGNGFSRAGRAT